LTQQGKVQHLIVVRSSPQFLFCCVAGRGIACMKRLLKNVVTLVFTYLNNLDHTRLANSCKSLCQVGSLPRSFSFRLTVINLIYGMNMVRCDWAKAGELLNAAEQTPEVVGLQGLLLVQRCDWRPQIAAKLYDAAITLWTQAAACDW
jgi:hypothetical protein